MSSLYNPIKPLFQYLSIDKIDTHGKLVGGMLVDSFHVNEFNDYYREVWNWNFCYMGKTNSKLHIKYVGLDLFNVTVVHVGM